MRHDQGEKKGHGVKRRYVKDLSERCYFAICNLILNILLELYFLCFLLSKFFFTFRELKPCNLII